MAYDEVLAARVRALLDADPTLAEKSMFGGRAFLLAGNLAVAAGPADLLVRVGADQVEHLVATTSGRMAVMGERTMRNWMEVDAADLADDESLASWVERGASYARALPPKT